MNYRESQGKIIISRHGVKYPGLDFSMEKQKFVPGSIDDKTRMHITPESQIQMAEQGLEVFGDEKYGYIYVVNSDHIRTTESSDAILTQVNFSMFGGVRLEELGLGGVDWKHPKMPKYTSDKAVQDQCVYDLFTNFFFTSREEGLANMAKTGVNFFNSLIQAIDRVQFQYKKEGDKVGIVHTTHNPVIDTFQMPVLDYIENFSIIHTRPSSGKAKISQDFFKNGGCIDMGEMITGDIYGLHTKMPVLEVTVKGIEKSLTYEKLNQIAGNYHYIATR